LTVEFSEAVSLSSLRFDPAVPVAHTQDGAATVRIVFSRSLDAGRRYVVDLAAADSDGNTISVLAPFIGHNGNPPVLVINEIRTEYSKPKVEFVEFYVSGSGNIGGLSLVSATVGFSEPVFTFPPLKVSAGDFIVVHLRSPDEGVMDELAAVDQSPGTDASPTARDFWVPGTAKRIRKTDVVAVLGTDGKPLDGIMFSEAPDQEWKTEELRSAADILLRSNAWVGPPASSVGCTTTRTLCRETGSFDSDTRNDWKVVGTGGATPGSANKDSVYAPSKK
jgi:hypothetical protein